MDVLAEYVSGPEKGQALVGEILVPVRPLCANLGLSWVGQQERIQRSEILDNAILGVRVTRPPGRGGSKRISTPS
jgi:hypothetical protein